MNKFLISLTGVFLLIFSLNSNLLAADGKNTYDAACAMCHATGVAAAPVTGKKENWTERVKKGKDELYKSAINGLGAMPAKGGQTQLSDANVAAAVDYMLAALEKSDEASTTTENTLEIDSANVQSPPVILTASQEQGKAIAYDRSKGNCLACHQILDGDFAGNSGPPLNNMMVRFPDRKVLRDQIYDATVKNPNSIMIPYGRHQVITDEELNLVTDFIHAL